MSGQQREDRVVQVGTSSRQTKTEAAFNAIRALIESGHLAGGERLILQSLAADLDMSLTPVREALKLLQAHGLVEYVPHQGHVVTRYSLQRAEEVYLLRFELEPLATRLAVEHSTAEDLAEIEKLHSQFTAQLTTEPGEHAAVVDLNARWHRRLYQAAKLPLLDDFIDRLWNGVPYQAIWFMHRRHSSLDDHETVMKALRAGDPEAASAAMLQHIRRGADATIKHLEIIGAPTN